MLERGDIVVLHGLSGDRLVVKRIVAVAGDRVHIAAGLVFLNGSPLHEPYAHHANSRLRELDEWPMRPGPAEVIIPARMLFVMGDNRSESSDSRLWGPVPVANVVGKVLLRLP
jgi:signal peptidase I